MSDLLKGLDTLAGQGLDALKQTQLEKTLKAAQTAKAQQAAGPTAKEEAAARDFEALLIEQMMQSMWRSVPSEGLLSGSREEELYRDMLNQALSKSFSEGQGIGIKEVILNEIQKRKGG